MEAILAYGCEMRPISKQLHAKLRATVKVDFMQMVANLMCRKEIGWNGITKAYSGTE